MKAGVEENPSPKPPAGNPLRGPAEPLGLKRRPALDSTTEGGEWLARREARKPKGELGGQGSPNQPARGVTVEPITDATKQKIVTLVKKIRAGAYHEALAGLERFSAEHPAHRNNSDAVYLKGYCLHKLGNPSAALKLWKQHEKMVKTSRWLRTVGDWTNPMPPAPHQLR